MRNPLGWTADDHVMHNPLGLTADDHVMHNPLGWTADDHVMHNSLGWTADDHVLHKLLYSRRQPANGHVLQCHEIFHLYFLHKRPTAGQTSYRDK